MTESQKPPTRKPLYHNIISLIGGLISVTSAILILFALLQQFTVKTLNPYVGILTYLVFPGILLFGAILILVGMRWEAGRRRRRDSLETLPYPNLDLNDARQRRLFGYIIVAGSVAVVLLSWTGYQGFHYTESVEFCGTTCHVAMEPEYTAYQDSAHARVLCASCHVGEGADWYLRSKLSGARQVAAVLFDTYQKPIPTPIHHLRPARETCERCHWPEKFFGSKLLQLPHFRYDENNTPEQVTLTLKTGGGSKAHGESTGIHWHMVVSNQVTYAAVDEKQQVIPWVKVKHADGSEAVYVSRKTKLSEKELEALPRRSMDCMDCHNRPAHSFPTPDSGIDTALLKGQIASDLPWIKKLTVEAVGKTYPDRDTAKDAIRTAIVNFYKKEYPDLVEGRKADIERAVQTSTAIWSRAVFPAMNVDWSTYPVNIGHRYWPGCFRCHDGEHQTKEGKVLARDCTKTCHTKPERGNVTDLGAVDPLAGDAWHPWEMPAEHLDVEGHDKVLCHECHQAGKRPSRECTNCHEK